MKYSKLGVKITFFLMFLIISSVLIYSLVFISSERARLKSEILKDGMNFGNFSSSGIYQDYIQYYRHKTEEDFLQFKTIVESELAKNPDIVGVSLVGVNGRILFDSSEFTNGQYKSDEIRLIDDEDLLLLLNEEEIRSIDRTNEGVNVVEIIVPIDESGIGHVASLKYTVSYNELNQRLTSVYTEALVTIIPVLLISLVLVIFFSNRLSAPIVKLKDLTKDISAGEAEISTGINSRDEIGELAKSFEEMSRDLLSSRKKLENYADDLEKKVDERTKELKVKVEELQKINNVIINREMKMIQLKKELKECKESRSRSD